MAADELEYWRTLAEERQKRIELLQTRLLAALETVPESEFERFMSLLDGRETGWMADLRALGRSHRLEQDDVVSVLEDVWARVGADRRR